MIELELVELNKIETLRLIHLFICGAGALFLIFLWKRVVSIDQDHKNDIGLLLLSGAFLMWVFMDAYRFTGLMKPGESSLIIKTFSAYNNAFFIAALPFFGNSFGWLHKRVKLFQSKTKWALAILVVNILLVMIYSFASKDENNSNSFVDYIDLVYSILTYILLGIALISRAYNSSLKRNLFPVTLVLSIVLIVVQFSFSPLFEITHYDLISVLALISQTVLAMVLISFGYEWLIQVSSSQAAEKNRTEEQIQIYIQENEKLKEELSQLQSEVKNERTLSALSARELEILKHINKSYLEIANELFISRDTVITHKKNIESKLGISGKKSLEEFAKNKGLTTTLEQ